MNTFVVKTGIVEVTLDRPAAKNSIGKEMLRGLRNAFETIESDVSAQVVLICSSVPKVFCAGADLKVMHSLLGLWFFSFSQ